MRRALAHATCNLLRGLAILAVLLIIIGVTPDDGPATSPAFHAAQHR